MKTALKKGFLLFCLSAVLLLCTGAAKPSARFVYTVQSPAVLKGYTITFDSPYGCDPLKDSSVYNSVNEDLWKIYQRLNGDSTPGNPCGIYFTAGINKFIILKVYYS